MSDLFTTDTRLMTLRGEVPAGDLRPGEMLLTLSGRGAALKPLLRAEAAPFPAQAVRIRAGAIAEGCPRRDLWLDPAHAVRCGDAAPVLAGALTNGATVLRDGAKPGDGRRLALAGPDIVLAEGLAIGLGTPGTDDQAARTRLRDRALALGWRETADPGLCVTVDGAKLVPLTQSDEACVVQLPPGNAPVWLLSRSAVPMDLDPAHPDARRLGVALGGLWLDDVPIPLDDPSLVGGFLLAEPGLRWTDGAGELRLPPRAAAARLRLQVLPLWTRYWVAPD
jgi:hypothetical protein